MAYLPVIVASIFIIDENKWIRIFSTSKSFIGNLDTVPEEEIAFLKPLLSSIFSIEGERNHHVSELHNSSRIINS